MIHLGSGTGVEGGWGGGGMGGWGGGGGGGRNIQRL